MAAVADYTALITSQHAIQPKFVALVSALTGTMVDLNNFLSSLPVEFDPEQARWTQLDALGVRVGLDRNLRATTPGLYVQVPPAGTAPLADSDYSIMLRGKMLSNEWLGTVTDAFTHVTNLFPTTGALVFIIDNQDMTMTTCVAGAVLDESMRQALACGYMQVRPAGVLSDYLFTSAAAPIFGLDVNNEFIGGLDYGAWGVGV